MAGRGQVDHLSVELPFFFFLHSWLDKWFTSEALSFPDKLQAIVITYDYWTWLVCCVLGLPYFNHSPFILNIGYWRKEPTLVFFDCIVLPVFFSGFKNTFLSVSVFPHLEVTSC